MKVPIHHILLTVHLAVHSLTHSPPCKTLPIYRHHHQCRSTLPSPSSHQATITLHLSPPLVGRAPGLPIQPRDPILVGTILPPLIRLLSPMPRFTMEAAITPHPLMFLKRSLTSRLLHTNEKANPMKELKLRQQPRLPGKSHLHNPTSLQMQIHKNIRKKPVLKPARRIRPQS